MFLAFVSYVLIAWGSVCAAVVAPVAQSVVSSYRWDNGYLYYGSYLVGCHNGQKYFGWNGANWVEGTPCPVETPRPSTPNYGLDTSKIHQGQHSVNGNPCSKEQAIQAIEKGGLKDDSGKLYLTVYGDGREGVIQDVNKSPALAEFRDKFHVQSYPANHWAVDPSLNFPEPKGNKPVILVTDASGKVIHAQKDYDDGTKGLANALTESLRKPVPHTDPNKFPDLRKGVKMDDIIAWLTSRSPLGIAWWVVLATVGVIYYVNRKKPADPVVVTVPPVVAAGAS